MREFMVCRRMECRDKTFTGGNLTHLQWVLDIQEGMQGKAAPVILKTSNSTVGYLSRKLCLARCWRGPSPFLLDGGLEHGL